MSSAGVRETLLGAAFALLTGCGEEFNAVPDAGPSGGLGGAGAATTSNEAGRGGIGGSAGEGGTGGVTSVGGSGAGGDGASGPRRVFVSSQALPGGGLQGLAGLDALCTALATNSTIGGAWVAWASTNDAGTATNAIDRITGEGPWILVNGIPVFQDRAQFLAGPSHAIDHTEFGSQTSEEPTAVWTGSFSEGTAAGNDCALWASSSSGNIGLAGDYTSLTESWTEAGPRNCNELARIYCFEL